MYQGKNGSTEHSKGNKTVPEKVATTRTEDEHKQDAKTSTTIQTKRTKEHWTTGEEREGQETCLSLHDDDDDDDGGGGGDCLAHTQVMWETAI